MPAKKSLSKTQIDKLGERLKIDGHSEDDLRLLEGYRSSFAAAYESALKTIRGLGEFPTGRVAKTTQSISAKLRRESLRLSQMQDIAGCRIIVPDIAAQNRLAAALKSNFALHTLFDRREKSSHGYRAVHLVVQVLGFPVEIQIRTALQQSWAELCEKAADLIDPEIKYGGGPADWIKILEVCSNEIFGHEKREIVFAEHDVNVSAANVALKHAMHTLFEAHRVCLELLDGCDDLFDSIESDEFSALIQSDGTFRSLVEEIVELGSQNELQSPRSLDQILECLRRSREELIADFESARASSGASKPMLINTSAILESSRIKIFEQLSRIADVLNSLEKGRTEDPQ